jgi:hypothetical protein
MADFFNPTSTAGVGPFVLGDTLSGTNFESKNVPDNSDGGTNQTHAKSIFGSYNLS